MSDRADLGCREHARPHHWPAVCRDAGLAWALLEVVCNLALKGWFMRLLEANPALAGKDKKKRSTATQAMPRVVCFIHNIVQARRWCASRVPARSLACGPCCGAGGSAWGPMRRLAPPARHR